MTDERRRMPRTSPDDEATTFDAGSPRAAPQPPRRRRGVAGGRIAAAGIGIAAMVGLVANMEVAGGKTAVQPPKDGGPTPSLADLRAEKSAFLGPATHPARVADAGKTSPIVLTPHAVVHTVGGGSSSGSSGSSGYSSGYSGGSSSAPAAAAPVASTSGSR